MKVKIFQIIYLKKPLTDQKKEPVVKVKKNIKEVKEVQVVNKKGSFVFPQNQQFINLKL